MDKHEVTARDYFIKDPDEEKFLRFSCWRAAGKASRGVVQATPKKHRLNSLHEQPLCNTKRMKPRNEISQAITKASAAEDIFSAALAFIRITIYRSS